MNVENCRKICEHFLKCVSRQQNKLYRGIYMKKIKMAGSHILTVALAASVLTSALVAAAVQYTEEKPSDDPWNYTMLSNNGNITLDCRMNAIGMDGDVRSNGSIYLTGADFYIDGDVVASEKISEDVLIIDTGRKFEGVDKIELPDKWDNVYFKATENNGYEYAKYNINGNMLEFNHTVLSDSDLSVHVLSDIISEDDPTKDSGEGKTGIFGAGFLTSAYDNYEKWKTIIPLFDTDISIAENGSGQKDVLELARKSGFIPIQEQAVGSDWENYDKLPTAAISNNFNDDAVSQYISQLKQDNPVFSIGSDKSFVIQAQWDNSTINPSDADTKSVTINGGNCTLNGEYRNIEEIKLENGGGTQLIGDFPNLKYIYKTSWSNLNLAGNFPSLECIYMPGGQLLLGTADKGFSSDNTMIINEKGSIVVYTAQNTKITDSELLSTQNILVRGSGKNEAVSEFNAENTLIAAGGSIMLEDMNDSETNRYENIPVYYAMYPISFINCNFNLMQGLFMTKSGAIIMAASDIDTMRGFLVAPNGINEYQVNSATGTYIDTYSYNISPGINSLNAQPDGSERIGSINKVEYTDFPIEQLSKVGNAEKFLSDINSSEFDSDLGHATYSPGVFTLNSYLLVNGNIDITADKIINNKDANSVIGSKFGNISINVTKEMDYSGVIYAPNGKVTLHGGGIFNGRIYAREIEIISDWLTINSRNIDVDKLGFSKEDIKPQQPTETTASVATTSITESGDVSVTTTVSEENDGNESSETTATEVSSVTSSTESTTMITTENTKPVDYNTNMKYEYDSLNRVIKAIYDEKNYIEYDYDANGNITKVTVVENGKEKE